MADSKKLRFSTPPILNIFSWKFHGLFLVLMGLIDVKGINVAHLFRELKISVFMSRPFFFSEKSFFASSQWKSVNIYRIARMGRNFDDYHDFQKNQGGYRIMKHTVYVHTLFYDLLPVVDPQLKHFLARSERIVRRAWHARTDCKRAPSVNMRPARRLQALT